MANGVVDGSVLQSLFGGVLQTAGLPAGLAGATGPVPVRCLALRVDAANGIATIRAMALDSSRLRLQGGGSVNTGGETLGIVVLPQLPMLANATGSPVAIDGSFTAPVVEAAPAGSIQATSGDICPAALKLGRFGQPGPAAAITQPPSAGMPGAAAPPSGAPKNLLNGLLGP